MIGHRFAALLAAALAAITSLAVAAAGGSDHHGRQLGYGQIRYRGLGPERWAQRWRVEHRELLAARVRLHRLLRADPSVAEAINLACTVYGNCTVLWRRAGCETGGTYNSAASNSSSGAAGLFQFLQSTWSTTPFAGFSVWSPYANALAAGWMISVGRGGEWSCR